MGNKGKRNNSVIQSFAMVTQFGISMLVPIFLCAFLGWYLDEKLGTSYLFIILFFVGALAGFRNIYIMSKKIYESGNDAKNDYEAIRRSIEKGKDEKTKRD